MSNGWPIARLCEVAQQRLEPVALEPDMSYSNLGVRWYGEGTFRREPKLGGAIKATQLFRVRAEQFIYNRLFATEGSFALVQPDDVTALVSNEFPVFDLDQNRLLPKFLYLYFQQPLVWDRVSRECVGTTKSRSRWKEERFLAHEIALPDLGTQRRVVDILTSADWAIRSVEASAARVMTVLEVMRDELLWEPPDRTTLADLCRVDGSLVSPIGVNAELPHVGAERIVSGTGDLVDVQSAIADGVTSGKYLFDASHVIYSKIRPNLRKVALPTYKGLCSADAYPLLPADGVPRQYLQQLLLSRPFTEHAVARSGRTKMPKINRSELMSIEIPLATPEQMDAATGRLNALDCTRRGLTEEVEAVRKLRSNLLSALLSGEHEIPDSYDELMEA